jgi:hypothetical protein
MENQEEGRMPSCCEEACVTHYFAPCLDVRWDPVTGEKSKTREKRSKYNDRESGVKKN